jgi:hypothetical protein
MFKNASIATLIILVIWLAMTVIRLENFRYATFVGFCSECSGNPSQQSIKRYECLKKTQTRTSPLWHLYHALVSE